MRPPPRRPADQLRGGSRECLTLTVICLNNFPSGSQLDARRCEGSRLLERAGHHGHAVTICLIVGLPGAGKTTRAKELEVSESALRLTPDEWQMAVFCGDTPTRWRSKERAEQRDRIEGKLVEVGLRAARLGVNVIFDFGLWAKDERSALRCLAHAVGVG